MHNTENMLEAIKHCRTTPIMADVVFSFVKGLKPT